jgi:hypothetical protein
MTMNEEITNEILNLLPCFTEDELHNLRAIKLNNGNDIIGCILTIDSEKLIVKRPCQIFRISDEHNNVSLLLTKWQPFSDDINFVISKISLVTYCKVNDYMKESYIDTIQKQIEDDNIPKTINDFGWPARIGQSIDLSKIN